MAELTTDALQGLTIIEIVRLCKEKLMYHPNSSIVNIEAVSV